MNMSCHYFLPVPSHRHGTVLLIFPSQIVSLTNKSFLYIAKSSTVNRLRSSNPSWFIASSPPSFLSTIETIRFTIYPKSRNTLTALMDEPPVVTTSSNTVILDPLGGHGPST